MATIKDAKSLLKTFSKQVDGKDSAAAESTYSQLKLQMIQMSSMPPNMTRTTTSKDERSLARDVYELAVTLSLKQNSMEKLERSFQLLRPFFFDYVDEIGVSKRREEIVALELLSLLVQSRLAEFYSVLELLTVAERAHKYIKFVIGLEQFLMEGSYNKVLAARKDSPSKTFAWLLEDLERTVRDEVASCVEVAYPTLSASAALKLMKLSSKSELQQIVDSRENWRNENGQLFFKSLEVEKHADLIPANQLISQTLQYANDLERIV